jgi:hypothetical protein
MFGAAIALIGAGCEVHERDHEAGGVGVSANVAVDEPQGAVIEGPGVEAIDVEPDPSARVYVYDEGYPPGTYLYNDYYYYGGYRYPRDVFVNRYVQENIRQHRFENREENRRQAQAIEQRHRTEFSKTHGRRESGPAQHNQQVPARQPESPRPNIERPGVTPNEQHRPAAERPEIRTPANEEHRANIERPENRPPANQPPRPAVEPRENRPPVNEEHRPNVAPQPERKEAPAKEARPREEQRKEEPRREEAK